MERLTPQQSFQIVQLYHENGRSVKSVYRALRPIYGVHNRPTERTIRHTISKLENNLTLLDNTRPIRLRTDRTVENIAAVNEFCRSPGRIDSAPILTTWPILWHYLGDF